MNLKTFDYKNNYSDFIKYLKSLSDQKYQEFNKNLGITEKIIGIKIIKIHTF